LAALSLIVLSWLRSSSDIGLAAMTTIIILLPIAGHAGVFTLERSSSSEKQYSLIVISYQKIRTQITDNQ